jgi:hypothetical protein
MGVPWWSWTAYKGAIKYHDYPAADEAMSWAMAHEVRFTMGNFGAWYDHWLALEVRRSVVFQSIVITLRPLKKTEK